MASEFKRMQQRRGTSTEWSTANPVLANGEIGYDTTTKRFRVGDGVTAWNSLTASMSVDDITIVQGYSSAAAASAAAAAAARDAAQSAITVNYLRATVALLNAVTGMTVNQTAFVTETGNFYSYSGSAWVNQGQGYLANKVDVSIGGAMAQNVRNDTFRRAKAYTAETYMTMVAPTLADAATPTFTINGSGEAVILTSGYAGATSRFIENGHRWLGAAPIDITVEGRVTAIDSGNTGGIACYIGDGTNYIIVAYNYNGAIGAMNSAGGSDAAHGGLTLITEMAYLANQTVKMVVHLDPNGVSYVDATAPNGTIYRKELTSIDMVGRVMAGIRRGLTGANTVISKFMLVDPMPDSAQVQANTNAISGLNSRMESLETASPGARTNFPLIEPLVLNAVNGHFWHGQSNSIGADAVPVLSVSQPYNNVSFNGGVRAWNGNWSYMPLVPLKEDSDASGGSGGAGVTLGETPASCAANYATTLRIMDGNSAGSHVIHACTAGRGTTTIAAMSKGSSWYTSAVAPMIAAAGAIPGYSAHIIPFVQGERDADDGTSRASYLAALNLLQADMEADLKAASGQTGPVYMMVVQISKYTVTNPGPALAQYDAVKNNPKVLFACPAYIIPYVNTIHYSSVGNKLVGAYVGRAYKQMLAGNKPDVLMPISVTRRANVLRVKFSVPQMPLRLDNVGMADTFANGFRVTSNNVTVPITSMSIEGDTVVIVLESTPTGAVEVRYGLDYSGLGRPAAMGCGNLRDSANDKVTISGVTYTLFNAAIAFAMPSITVSE